MKSFLTILYLFSLISCFLATSISKADCEDKVPNLQTSASKDGTYGIEGDHISTYYSGVKLLETNPQFAPNTLASQIIKLDEMEALPSQFEKEFEERDLLQGNDKGGMLCGLTCTFYMVQAVSLQLGHTENSKDFAENPENLMELLIEITKRFMPGDPRFGTDEIDTGKAVEYLFKEVLGVNADSDAISLRFNGGVGAPPLTLSDFEIKPNQLLGIGISFPGFNHAQLAIDFNPQTQILTFVDPSFKGDVYQALLYERDGNVYMDIDGEKSGHGRIQGIQRLSILD